MVDEGRARGRNGDDDDGVATRRAKRPYRSREERRAEIVEATLSILAERGMHAWTTSALAERVGCSEATIFKHFRSKDEILAEALRRQAASLRRRISEYRGQGSGWERTRELVLHILDAVREAGGGPLVILLGQASRIHPEMGREAQETMAFFRRRIEALLAEDGASGEGGTDPSLLAQLVLAVAHSSALRWMVSDRNGSPATIARPMLDTLEPRTAGKGAGG